MIFLLIWDWTFPSFWGKLSLRFVTHLLRAKRYFLSCFFLQECLLSSVFVENLRLGVLIWVCLSDISQIRGQVQTTRRGPNRIQLDSNIIRQKHQASWNDETWHMFHHKHIVGLGCYFTPDGCFIDTQDQLCGTFIWMRLFSQASSYHWHLFYVCSISGEVDMMD